MIQVEQLTKYFVDRGRGAIAAVDHISFDAQPGEIFGLLGPNGAGKTTTMRLLCTVLRPSAGRATIAGFDLATQPEQIRKHIGFLSASTHVYDRMTAWEFVEFYARLNGLAGSKLRARMDEVFDLLQMNDFRDVLGASLSTGMKQKTSLARAIVHDPPVLIFDEPTAGLDVLVAHAVLQNIERLRELGKCILLSTHIMREAEKLCGRLAIIHKGRILTQGSQKELRDKHGTRDLEELFFSLVT